ncbi:MAG: DUF4349 domain-containing protein [Alkaliphilus sp.]|nr:DUF4349 domain-containing protein [Alkaliphilus sp.]
MKCNDIQEQISLYIDNMLDDNDKEILIKHLEECNQCSAEYDSLIAMINMCRELPMLELPENYEIGLNNKLKTAEAENEEKVQITTIVEKIKQKNWKVYASIAAVFIVFVISVTGLNSVKTNEIDPGSEIAHDNAIIYEQPTASPEESRSDGNMQFSKSSQDSPVVENEIVGRGLEPSSDMMAPVDAVESQVITDGRKVIKNAFLSLDIENYDEKFEKIINLVNASGGYVEHSDTQYSHYVPDKPEESLKIGSITARVPENTFLSIVDQVKGVGIVTNFGMGGQDITMQYRDTVNEVENLKIQEKRLREIMEKADNVKDILEVERELSRVRGDINRMTGDIKRWDDLVGLSTINISLNEIIPKDKKIEPVSDNIWEKAGKGFIRTINEMVSMLEVAFVGFVSILPLLLLMLVIGTPTILFIKKLRRRQ